MSPIKIAKLQSKGIDPEAAFSKEAADALVAEASFIGRQGAISLTAKKATADLQLGLLAQEVGKAFSDLSLAAAQTRQQELSTQVTSDQKTLDELIAAAVSDTTAAKKLLTPLQEHERKLSVFPKRI